MTDLRKAAERALDALEDIFGKEKKDVGAINALRQALTQPEQEPVYAFRRKGLDDFCTCDKRRYDELVGKPNLFEVAVFYTAPPKKEWVGLSDEEIWKCNKAETGSAVEFHICSAHQNVLDFAEAIEAKLKEKNNG